jgi:hypothetical protein
MNTSALKRKITPQGVSRHRLGHPCGFEHINNWVFKKKIDHEGRPCGFQHIDTSVLIKKFRPQREHPNGLKNMNTSVLLKKIDDKGSFVWPKEHEHECFKKKSPHKGSAGTGWGIPVASNP